MRFKQQPIGQFGRKDARHGLHGYKRYACRCAICSAAMSAYGKSHYVPKLTFKPAPKAEPQTLQSWWIGKSRTELAANVQTEQARMSAAKITGRPVVPDGWR